MAKVTREQLTRWNAKLNNSFELDLQQFLIWNEKSAQRMIDLPDGKKLNAKISWYEVTDKPDAPFWQQKVIGVRPCLDLSIWTPTSTPGMWSSRGVGAKVELTDKVYAKRNWNELAKFTAEWNDQRILDEAKKHTKELQNDLLVG